MPYLGDTYLTPVQLARLQGSQQYQLPLADVLNTQGQGVLSSLARTGVSGLSGAANLLDLPGSVVRDALAGENPIDQLLSPFSAKNRVTGRGLLRSYDLIGNKDTWGNFAGGLAAEVLTDPMMLLNPFGALSKGGNLLKSRGLLKNVPEIASRSAGIAKGSANLGKRVSWMSTKVDDVLKTVPESELKILEKMAGGADALKALGKSKVGGTVGVGLLNSPWAVFSPGGKKYAKFLDTAGEAIRYGKYSPIRALAGPLSKISQGASTGSVQKKMPDFVDAVEEGISQGRGEFAEILSKYPDAPKYLDHAHIMNSTGAGAKASQETLNKRHSLATQYVENPAKGFNDPSAPPGFKESLDEGKSLLEKGKAFEGQSGLDTVGLGDMFSEYWPRVRKRFPKSIVSGGGRGGAEATHGAQIGRMSFLKDTPGGTDLFQRMSVDPQISGVGHHMAKGVGRPGVDSLDDAIEAIGDEGAYFLGSPKLTKAEIDNKVAYVMKEYGPDLQQLVGPQGTPIGLDEKGIRSLTKWVLGLDPLHAQQNIPAFETNLFATLQARLEHGYRAASAMRQASKTSSELAGTLGDVQPGRGANFAEHLDKISSGRGANKKATAEAMNNALEDLKGNPALDVARQEAAAERAAATQQAGWVADRKGDELVESVSKPFGALETKIDSLMSATAKSQSTLVRLGAEERMAGVLDEILTGVKDLGSGKLQQGDLDTLLSAVEEVKPEAIRDPALKEFSKQVESLIKPVLHRIKAAHDAGDVLELQKAVSALDPVLKAAGKIRRQIARTVKERFAHGGVDDATRQAIGDIPPSASTPDNIAGLAPADPAVRPTTIFPEVVEGAEQPVGKMVGELANARLQKVRDEFADKLGVIFGKADNAAEKAAIRAAKKFGGDVVDHVPNDDTLRQVGELLTNTERLEDLDLGAVSGILKKSIADIRDQAAAKIKGASAASVDAAPYDEARDILSRVWLPEDAAADIHGIMKGYLDPKTIHPLWQAMDSFLSNWKSGVTSWPAFHVRNHGSGHAQSFLANSWDPLSYKQGGQLAKGNKELRNFAERIPDFKGMTDRQATDAIRKELFQEGVVDARQGLHAEASNISLPGLVGDRPFLSPKPAGTTSLQRANPLVTETFAPYRISRDVGNVVEAWNRATPYINLRSKGWSPREAAKRVKAIQVDYTKMAQIDPAMKRIAPFWMFTSRVLPFTIAELVEKPGGRMAQTLRGLNRLRDPNELTPDYVAETASIPLRDTMFGSNVPGTQRYVTGLGMMFEDPASFAGGGSRGAILEGASRLNPILKGALEWGTGQSFFQKGPLGGRAIEDLDPTIGRTVSNIQQLYENPEAILSGGVEGRVAPAKTSMMMEHILGNSPAARLLTSARTATDPRKNLLAKMINLGTGVRLSDVSPASQDSIIREQAQNVMKKLGGRSFSRVYIPKDDIEKMPRAKQIEALQFNALMNLLAGRAKKRAKARK